MIILDCCGSTGITGMMALRHVNGFAGFTDSPRTYLRLTSNIHVTITRLDGSVSLDRSGWGTMDWSGILVDSGGDFNGACWAMYQGTGGELTINSAEILSETQGLRILHWTQALGAYHHTEVVSTLSMPISIAPSDILAEAQAILDARWNPPDPGQIFVSPTLLTFRQVNDGPVIQQPNSSSFSAHARRVVCSMESRINTPNCWVVSGLWYPILLGGIKMRYTGAAVSTFYFRYRGTPHCIYTQTASDCDHDFASGPDGIWDGPRVVERTCMANCDTGTELVPPAGVNVMRKVTTNCAESGCAANPLP